MAYTTIDDPSKFFNIKLYTGNSGTQVITGVGFQPDWTWIKQRSDNTDNTLYDTVRGATKRLRSNSTAAEATDDGLTAWNSDGFNVGNYDSTNLNNSTYVAWNWLAGTSFTNDASSTSVGSIDSAGSVNTDAGFAIISYTGTGSAETIAHGLGTTPDLIISRKRNNTGSMFFWNQSLSATQYLSMDTTNAVAAAGSVFGTLPTTTVYSTGGGNGTGASGHTFISYLFAEKKGYSKFGTYTGNANADGRFVYTGFKPAYVIIKQTSGSGEHWIIKDNKRGPRNINTGIDSATLFTSANTAESNRDGMDFLSNGFKCRDNGGPINSGSYVFMAFAEEPFVSSKGVPATAG